ncbi:unnamed protein product [Taenia asiatica]|uniref:Secreted protein n=1 Tax=Taenia asiatica TaxID=60517 RepID=A0A0R3VZG8_TAEAS|nr:unnamed protein product [Taenia asiatica]
MASTALAITCGDFILFPTLLLLPFLPHAGLQVNFGVEDYLIGEEEGEGREKGQRCQSPPADAWARCCDWIAQTTSLPPRPTTWMVPGRWVGRRSADITSSRTWVISASPSRGKAQGQVQHFPTPLIESRHR